MEVGHLLPFIILFPALSFGIIALWGTRLKSAAGLISVGAILLSFIFTVNVFRFFIQDPENVIRWNYPFVELGSERFVLGLSVDGMTALMLILVTFVGSLIHIYSVGYMHGDEGYHRYFGYLSLFTASMLLLVLADNFLFLYVGWEMVGFTSYSLIGFWYRKPSASKAGKKAFLTTRTGDLGFLVGWLLVYSATGSLLIETARELSLGGERGAVLAGVAGLLIFWGAMGKSAQFPLHVWLPDAMEGPTPVSALIHAATMVAAGVYLVARVSFLFEGALWAQTVVLYVGAFTALFAATLGVAMMDIKRVMAYSTVSQLGYMMAGLGAGAVAQSVFHLLTHGFFKALLFLGAGSVIHAVHSNDMLHMGGLKKYMPITYWTLLAGSLALVGIPPFSGFFSKDEILAGTLHAAQERGHWIPFIMLVLGVFFTSFYVFRMLYLTFGGSYRGRRHRPPHESPPVMTIPLIILALFSFAGALVFRGPVLELLHGGGEPHFNVIVPALSLAMAGAGLYLAYLVYGVRRISPYAFQRTYPALSAALVHKYYFDELYDTVIVRPGMALAALCARFDRLVIDGLINLVGYIAVGCSFFSGFSDKYIVDGLVNLIAYFTGMLGSLTRRLQTGNAQTYAGLITAGVLIIMVLMQFRMGR
ncbi:MAG: NADH-quinone oxidoreductase subunit L [bacterium JZ-2024 1]